MCADTQIVHPRRPLPDGSGGAEVDNEDIASALLRFESGARGLLSSSRVAWGRKNHLAVELHGERGTIALDQERMNELELFEAREPLETQGFRTILTGPAHPPYGEFCPAPGHGLGFNDQKIIEVAHLLRGIAGREPLYPSVGHALHFERAIHAIDRSARSGRWERVEGST